MGVRGYLVEQEQFICDYTTDKNDTPLSQQLSPATCPTTFIYASATRQMVVDIQYICFLLLQVEIRSLTPSHHNVFYIKY